MCGNGRSKTIELFFCGHTSIPKPCPPIDYSIIRAHNEAAFIVGSNVVIRRNTYIRRTTYYCANVILCHASPLTYTLDLLGLYLSVPVL